MFEELVLKNRSYRGFDRSVPVTRELMLRWLGCVRTSPSARNLQMLKFKPVTDADACSHLLALTRWGGALPQMHLPPEGHEPTAFLVVCADLKLGTCSENTMIDVGIAAQTFLLAATEDGFGGCMLRNFSHDGVHDLLGLSEWLSPQLVIGLGKPAEVAKVVDLPESGSVNYYRENGIHCVPKRSLDELVI
ncbi:MAG: nitroreductase family protein [Clostridia bacterium]|nr:nitroreductase family protein [Clostridia bacterium]